MSQRLIITDTGPLIIFARSNKLSILCGMAKQIIITDTVMHECTDDIRKPGAFIINQAITNILTLVDDVSIGVELSKIPLDAGEKSAISLTISMSDPELTLLIDEKLGRKVAHALHLKIIGSAGILVAAKKVGIIDKVEPVIMEWRQLGYFMSEDLVKKALISAGEWKDF